MKMLLVGLMCATALTAGTVAAGGLTATGLVATTSTPVPTAEAPVKGDLDCSGTVTALDALHILRYIAELPVTLPPGCAAIGS